MTSSFLAGISSDHPCIGSTLYTLETWVVWTSDSEVKTVDTAEYDDILYVQPQSDKSNESIVISVSSVYSVIIVSSLNTVNSVNSETNEKSVICVYSVSSVVSSF